MKYLTDRQQIAVAMNFGKYPVLHIDRETPEEGYKDYFVGDQVKVLTPRVGYPDMYCTGKLYWEYGRYGVLTDGTMLSGSFGYSDVMRMLKNAQAPVIKAGQKVIVVEDFPIARKVAVHMMKVSDRVDGFVYPCCTLEEIEE